MEGSIQDKVVPKGRWAFGEDVTECFDDMLERSIPQYAVMRRACYDIGKTYLQEGSYVVDIGCSRGTALAPFVIAGRNKYRYLGLEVSPPMVRAAQTRLHSHIRDGYVEIREHDLRNGIPEVDASVILSVLTLQFTPIEYRHQLLKEIYSRLRKGGALILVEKVLGESCDLNDLFVKTYYGLKEQNGYSQDDISRKKMSLEGVLVPVTAHWNEELLRTTGFTEVDCFWRWMNFAGWVAVK